MNSVCYFSTLSIKKELRFSTNKIWHWSGMKNPWYSHPKIQDRPQNNHKLLLSRFISWKSRLPTSFFLSRAHLLMDFLSSVSFFHFWFSITQWKQKCHKRLLLCHSIAATQVGAPRKLPISLQTSFFFTKLNFHFYGVKSPEH